MKGNHKTNLARLDGGVLGNDTAATAGRVEQDAVEAAHNLGELAPVVVAHDGVGHAETVQVRNERFGASLGRVRQKEWSNITRKA